MGDPLTLFIPETFTSIQGEGLLTGVTSVFLRTSGCNLRCRWCDTPYTSWEPTGRHETVAALVSIVEASPARHVVITGGEPMLQAGIEPLTATLSAAGQPARAEFQPRGPRPVEVVVHVRGDASKACREGGEFFPMVTESLCPS